MCPGNHESAGKTRNGNAWLRKLLVEAAHAAAPNKNIYLSAQDHRLASQRDKKKAVIDIGHTIVVIIYYLLCDQKFYMEDGGNYFLNADSV
jgi:transposase